MIKKIKNIHLLHILLCIILCVILYFCMNDKSKTQDFLNYIPINYEGIFNQVGAINILENNINIKIYGIEELEAFRLFQQLNFAKAFLKENNFLVQGFLIDHRGIRSLEAIIFKENANINYLFNNLKNNKIFNDNRIKLNLFNSQWLLSGIRVTGPKANSERGGQRQCRDRRNCKWPQRNPHRETSSLERRPDGVAATSEAKTKRLPLY
jgi:hypothetical protein